MTSMILTSKILALIKNPGIREIKYKNFDEPTSCLATILRNKLYQ
jgi:hypothetical protein